MSVNSSFTPHNMTGNTSQQWPTSSPFTASASTNPTLAFRVFDADAYDYPSPTYWQGTNSGVDWLEIDMGVGASYTPTQYTVKAWNPSTNAPKSWTFQGSNDNSTWTTLDTRTSETGWQNDERRFYTVTGSAAYRYFRLNITATNGTTATDIQEFSIAGSGTGSAFVGTVPTFPLAAQTLLLRGAPSIASTAVPIWPSIAFPNAVVGIAYNFNWDLTPASAPTTYTLIGGSLPASLTLSNVSGDIGNLAGTPTTGDIASYSFTLRATNVYGHADHSFTLNVVAAGGGGGAPGRAWVC
jgi:hypothetical protein